MRGAFLSNVRALIKTAKFERGLILASYTLVPLAISNTFKTDIFFLLGACILTYGVGGLINAKVDNDTGTKYLTEGIIVLFLLALLVSLKNYIITITVFVGLIMGYLYSKFSRKIVFADSFILSITHVFIPIMSSALIFNVNIIQILPLTIWLMVFYNLIVQMKNLRGVEDDIKNNYKTPMTTMRSGKLVIHSLMKLSLIVLFAIYFVFNMGQKYLIVILIIFILQIVSDIFMAINKELKAYPLFRLIAISVPFAIALDQSGIKVYAINLAIILIYITYYTKNFKQKEF